MKNSFANLYKNIRVSGLLLSFCLVLAPGESQANLDCSLEEENTCRIENNWESLSKRETPQATGKPPSYDQYAHRQGGCGPEGMPHDERGCMQGRHGGRHGMMGMHHHSDSSSTEQCPQERKTATAPRSYLESKNPLEQSSENIEQGRLLYQQNAEPSCVLCHGRAGDGLGQMGSALIPSPRNFTCVETMDSISDGQLFWIIENGSEGTGMPAFGNLGEESIWQVILYLRQFAK